MNYRPLGSTGLRVSEIGFGTWGLGGSEGGLAAYGPANDKESLRSLHRAFDWGITFYDTADLYGFGRSERLLGQAFAARRDQVVIATKAGIVSAEGKQDFTPAHLDRALSDSLERLRTDYVDIFLLHNPPLELLEQNPALLTLLATLRREGKLRAWGVSVRSPEDGMAAAERFGCKVIEVNFNLADQRARQNGLLDLCARGQTGCIVRTPLCFGFLTGLYAAEGDFAATDHRSRWAPEQRRRWVEAGRAFNAALVDVPGQTPAQAALRFCLSYPGVSTTIPGMLTAEHVDDNASASTLGPMSADQLARLEQLYEKNDFFLGYDRPVPHATLR